MKSFATINDAENEFQRIFAAVRPLLTVEASMVSIRGRKPIAAPSAAKKIGTSNKSILHKSVTSLEKLREQQKVLDNLIANINAQFRGDDDPAVKKILDNAAKLRTTVERQLNAESKTSHTRTEGNISPEANQIAKQVKTHYEKKTGSTGTISYADGLKDGQHIMCVYVTMHNIKNFAGEVTPEHVIAITQIGDEFFINPGLTKEVPPGKFTKGFKIHNRNDAIRFADAQFEADSNISAINSKPVPIEPVHLKTTGTKNVVFKDNYISVTLPDKIKTVDQATEASNSVFRELKSAVKAVNPKNNDRIVYALKKSKANYVVQFKFTSGSAGNGRTISHEQQKTLLTMFTPEEMKRIRQALSD